jgi:predicted outer membrane repeat protein
MVTNSLFQDNMSAGSGGGLAGSFNPVTVVDSHFVNNTAVGNGAGLSSAGNLFITNNLFQQNQATTGNGGGLYTSGSVVVTNTTFMENRAAVDGGGAYINSNSTFISGTFSNNQSLNGSGGGLYGNSAVTADNTQFINNDAGLDGGGLHSRFGRATLTHVTIKNNSAQRSGGGVSIGRFVTLSATMILSNTADLGGGVAISSTFDGPTENHVVNVLLARNQAASDGDALYHNLNRTLNVIHTAIANPTQSANQAIYVISGTVNVVNTIIANHGIGIEAAASGSATADFVNYFDNGTNEVGLSGTNLTTGNPLFVNAAADDYRLAVGSASLENGTNAGIGVDIRGVVRPIGSGFDRGAYEGTHTPTAVTLNTFTAKTVTTAWLWILLSLLLTVVSFTGYKRKP